MTLASKLRQFSKKDWLNPLSLLLIGYYLVMAIVGTLIPDDILSANAWARDFSDVVASIVPQIDRITALGIKPDVNRFYFSVLWAVSPVLVLTVLAFFALRPFRAEDWRQAGAPKYQSLLFLLAVMLVCGIWPQTLFWVDPAHQLTQVLMGNFVARALFAQLIWVVGPCLFLAVSPFAFAAWYLAPQAMEPRNG